MHILILVFLAGFAYWKISSQDKKIQLLESENAILKHKLETINVPRTIV